LTETEKQKITIAQVAITVKDIDRSRIFYRDTLELPLLIDVKDMAFFDCGPVRLMVGGSKNNNILPGNTIIYLDCPDIDAAIAKLKAQDIHIEQEPMLAHKDNAHELWLAFFTDPDGHILAYMENRRTPMLEEV
jgi:methylmalonyl-CoA/ethylmalonyl-CoA epimerase